MGRNKATLKKKTALLLPVSFIQQSLWYFTFLYSFFKIYFYFCIHFSYISTFQRLDWIENDNHGVITLVKDQGSCGNLQNMLILFLL